MGLPKQSPWWLLLFGLAALAAGLYSLVDGVVRTPGTFGFSGSIARDQQPGAYWLLTLAYLAAGGLFVTHAGQQLRDPDLAPEPEPPPRRPSPPWARGIAWLGVACSIALLATAIALHSTLGPLMSLMFVVLSGGGGVLIGLVSVGYLVTGRIN